MPFALTEVTALLQLSFFYQDCRAAFETKAQLGMTDLDCSEMRIDLSHWPFRSIWIRSRAHSTTAARTVSRTRGRATWPNLCRAVLLRGWPGGSLRLGDHEMWFCPALALEAWSADGLCPGTVMSL